MESDRGGARSVEEGTATTDGNPMSPNEEVVHLLERLSDASKTGTGHTLDVVHLDSRTRALVVIGAAVCTDAPTKIFQSLVRSAFQAGATAEEVLGSFLAVAPAAGGPRVVAVAPKIALALGYDVDAAFEHE